MNFKHSTLIVLSGLVWLAVGTSLLTLGLNLILNGTQTGQLLNAPYPWIEGLAPIFGSLEYAAVALIALGLFIGYFKGRYVLARSAEKGVIHIRKLCEPAPLHQMYALKNYILIAGMMGLGMTIKALGIPSDIRGFIDVAVGAALIHGAMAYFKSLWVYEKALT
jgi:hypothetical protein